MASQLITGAQPSQGTMTMQGIRANRIITGMNNATTERGQDIAAGVQRSGQASQERMATQQEQGVTQRNDAQIAASKAAREEDRVNSEALMKIQNDNVMQRDEIDRSWKESIYMRDFKSAEKWRERYMAFDQETARLQAGVDAAKWKAMNGYMKMNMGQLTHEATQQELFNKAAEQGEIMTVQDEGRKTAINSMVDTWEEGQKKSKFQIGSVKDSPSRISSEWMTFGASERLDDVFTASGMSSKVNSRILMDPIELAKVSPSWGSAEYWTAMDSVRAAIDKYKTFADGKEKEDGLLKLYQMHLNLVSLLNGPDKDHITGLKQQRGQSSLVYAAKRRADEGGGPRDLEADMDEAMKIIGELNPALGNSYSPRPGQQ